MDDRTSGPRSEIVLNGVTKRFRVDGHVVPALENVDMVGWSAEFVTIIGPSGCGKSTLFNLICGLMEPDEGEIRLAGAGGGPRLGTVAYMLQKDLLLPWRTVLDNVILGPELSGMPRIEAYARARELLPLFGLEGFETSYPATLSGGMRQRAALLRTFLTERQVMALDEPFGALDALTRVALQDWLLGVWTRMRKTILFVTHDVEEAVYMSDRIYVMTPRPGRMAMEVTVELPRPRARHMVTTEPFLQMKQELLRALTGSSEAGTGTSK